jgi:hypothetical protein
MDDLQKLIIMDFLEIIKQDDLENNNFKITNNGKEIMTSLYIDKESFKDYILKSCLFDYLSFTLFLGKDTKPIDVFFDKSIDELWEISKENHGDMMQLVSDLYPIDKDRFLINANNSILTKNRLNNSIVIKK